MCDVVAVDFHFFFFFAFCWSRRLWDIYLHWDFSLFFFHFIIPDQSSTLIALAPECRWKLNNHTETNSSVWTNRMTDFYLEYVIGSHERQNRHKFSKVCVSWRQYHAYACANILSRRSTAHCKSWKEKTSWNRPNQYIPYILVSIAVHIRYGASRYV